MRAYLRLTEGRRNQAYALNKRFYPTRYGGPDRRPQIDDFLGISAQQRCARIWLATIRPPGRHVYSLYNCMKFDYTKIIFN